MIPFPLFLSSIRLSSRLLLAHTQLIICNIATPACATTSCHLKCQKTFSGQHKFSSLRSHVPLLCAVSTTCQRLCTSWPASLSARKHHSPASFTLCHNSLCLTSSPLTALPTTPSSLHCYTISSFQPCSMPCVWVHSLP